MKWSAQNSIYKMTLLITNYYYNEFFFGKTKILFIKVNPPYTFTTHFTISLKMLNETHSKKSWNRNPTKSRNSTESPELCRISRTGDVLKVPFLQKRIKKNVNKRSYVLKIKKTFTSTPFTSRNVLKSPILQKRIKKNINKCSYVLKNKKKPSPPPHLPPGTFW
jgi:hypothetical protein